MNNEVSIREYREGDEYQIIRLYNNEYKTNKTFDEWRWEFLNGPLGPATVVIAEYKENIIGVNAQILVPLYYNNRLILSGKNEQSIISKEFRGRGIFQLLVRKCLAVSKSKGIDIIWGFTYAIKPFTRSGYSIIGRTKHQILVLDRKGLEHLIKNSNKFISRKKAFLLLISCGAKLIGTIASVYSKLIIGKYNSFKNNSYKIEEILLPSIQDFDDFWVKIVKEIGAATIERKGEYIKWRIYDNPCLESNVFALRHNCELQGIIITSINKTKNTSYITDIFVRNGNWQYEAACLMKHAVRYLKSRGVYLIDFMMFGGDLNIRRYSRLLNRSGFIPITIKGAFMIQKLLMEDDGLKELENPNNWNVNYLFSEGIR